MNKNFFGLGHVYHSRHEGMDNRFRYPSFYCFFNCQNEDAVQKVFRKLHRRFLSIKASDYLQGQSGDLENNIKQFLFSKCQGYQPDQIWLHTMPRMFGYAFNPVSFWFCQSAEKWEAVLVEVHNTFGERHFYWIQPQGGIQDSSWYEAEKTFHVSPFFPVNGFYKFRFQINEDETRVDINHYAPNASLRLATWVQGTHAEISTVALNTLLAKYGWITPLVVLRIHWQALRLWLQKTKFYPKPKLPSKEVSS